MKTRIYRILHNAGTEDITANAKRFGGTNFPAYLVRATSPESAIQKAAKSLHRPPETLHVCHIGD